MIWDDTGYLLSKNRYNENSLIAELYTKNHGKVTGIIFGGTSKKIKNYLQIGNNLHINFNSKSENRIGYFKIEIQQAFSPYYFDNQILYEDPFKTIDQKGVGQLVQIAVEKAKQTKPKIKIGICGEHGGDPKSIYFFNSLGLDYVSCSPYRIPIAYLAAAKASFRT